MYTTDDRAKRIAALLLNYSEGGGTLAEQDPADFAYAIADIMHWAERHAEWIDSAYEKGDARGFDALVSWAREHYDEERGEPRVLAGQTANQVRGGEDGD